MADDYKQLAQARENSTNAVSVYSPAASTTTIIRCITICNTSGATANVDIFIDDDGTTYDETTAIVWNGDVPQHGFTQIDAFWVMDDSGGNLAYRSSVANALTITLFGDEQT